MKALESCPTNTRRNSIRCACVAGLHWSLGNHVLRDIVELYILVPHIWSDINETEQTFKKFQFPLQVSTDSKVCQHWQIAYKLGIFEGTETEVSVFLVA